MEKKIKVEYPGRTICPVCHATVAVLRDGVMRQHLDHQHPLYDVPGMAVSGRVPMCRGAYEREQEVLERLDPVRWLRPSDVGSTAVSHHRPTLAVLVRKGLAQRTGLPRAYRYRLTENGERARKETRDRRQNRAQR